VRGPRNETGISKGRTIGALVAKILDQRFISQGSIVPGDEIISIDGHIIRDGLDVIFYSAGEEIKVGLRRPDGTEAVVSIRKPIDGQLGIELVPDKIRICKANCDFCFIRQQPKKRMRRALYIKDDDYRLSFLHGNFITLTNMKPEDYTRIFEQRLSPLYVSVHATEDDVRRRLLSAPKALPIMAELKRLIENGISVHTQNVIVPGINDGDVLEKTLDDLASLYPGVLSISVVPVGLTRYRERLPKVKLNSPGQGRQIIKQVDRAREKFLKQYDDPLVYAADELFVLADMPIPACDYYGEFPQLENGIGLVRRLCDDFDREFGRLPDALPEPKELTLITGRSAEPFLCDQAARVTRNVKNLTVSVLAADNAFWGETVTVSGLLTGGDIAAALKTAGAAGKDVLLPPDCLNGDALFLDDQTPQTVATASGCRIHTSSFSLIDSLLSVVSP